MSNDTDVRNLERIFNEVDLEIQPRGSSMMLDGNQWFPRVEPDFAKLYEAFKRAHKQNKEGYHQVYLNLVQLRVRVSEFMEKLKLGIRTSLLWDRPYFASNENERVTLKEHMAEMGYDMTIFDLNY